MNAHNGNVIIRFPRKDERRWHVSMKRRHGPMALGGGTRWYGMSATRQALSAATVTRHDAPSVPSFCNARVVPCGYVSRATTQSGVPARVADSPKSEDG